jgi:hypothetical protein
MVEPILITPERPAKRRHTGTNVSFADNQQTPVNMGQSREKSTPSTIPTPVEQEPPASTTGITQTTEPAGTAEQSAPEKLPEEPDVTSQKSRPSYKMTPFEKLLWAERNHPWYQRYAKKKNWHQDDNQLWRTASNKLVIPPKDSIRDQVMEACHDSVFSGHFSHPRTLHLVERLFYWPEMSRDIEKFCRSCTVCGEVKSYNRAKQGASLPHPVPEGKWSDVTCDMIVDLPTTARGNNAILLFVDKCTKMTHAVATSKELNSQEFCFLFNKDVVRLHGAPKQTHHRQRQHFLQQVHQESHCQDGMLAMLWHNIPPRVRRTVRAAQPGRRRRAPLLLQHQPSRMGHIPTNGRVRNEQCVLGGNTRHPFPA